MDHSLKESESESKLGKEQRRKRDEKVEFWKIMQKLEANESTTNLPSAKSEMHKNKKETNAESNAIDSPGKTITNSETNENWIQTPQSLNLLQTKEELAEQLGLSYLVYNKLTRDEMLESLYEAFLSEPSNNEADFESQSGKDEEFVESKGPLAGDDRMREISVKVEKCGTNIDKNISESEINIDKQVEESGTSTNTIIPIFHPAAAPTDQRESEQKFNENENIAQKLSNPTPKQLENVKDTKEFFKEIVGGKNYTCNHCKKVYKKEANLDKHVQYQHDAPSGSQEKRCYSCKHCKDLFSVKRELMRHMAKKHQDGERKFICDICRASYKRQGNLDNHQQVSHCLEKENNNIKLCSICSKSYTGMQSLNCHIRRIHGNDQKSVICSDCGKYFKYQHCLTSHVRNVHMVTHDQCGKCQKICKNKPALEKHMRYNHS